MSIWNVAGRQLRCPTGGGGRLAGWLMRFANASPNRAAIAALGLEWRHCVLELGCGPGHAMAMMARDTPGVRIVGLDASPVMLRQAARRNRRELSFGVVRLLCAPFAPLPFDDRSFDRVLAVNVAYFWDDADAVLREARRVLRPNGRIAIYATDASTMERWRFAGRGTHRHWTAADLTEALHAAQFAAADVRAVPMPWGTHGLVAVATA